MAVTRISKQRTNRKNGRGMTLVELIVVLVILAILSSAGIGAAVGYVKKSAIETNQKNAETIYQAAQTALQQMQKAGGVFSNENGKVDDINDWVNNLISKGEAYAFDATNLSEDNYKERNLTKYMFENKSYYASLYKDEHEFKNFDPDDELANESVHMRYVLVYTSKNAENDQGKILKQLLQPYFSDATVFQGTMALEFDVEKSADAYGEIHLTAKCLSVFYDSRTKNGWQSNVWGTISDKTVPNRDAAYRSGTSLIGYYDGYAGTAVDTVYLPKVQEGIVVKKFTAEYEPVTPTVIPTGDPDPATTTTPTPEPTPVTHTRLTWAATLDKANLVGSGKDVYYKIDLMNGDTVAKILILNEDFLRQEDPVDGNKHSIDYFTALANVDIDDYDEENKPTWNGYDVTVKKYTAVYSNDVKSTVTKKSIVVIANVYVANPGDTSYGKLNNDGITGKFKKMPLRISYVSGELDYKSDSEHPSKAAYIEYSLDLTGDDNTELYTVPVDTFAKAVITVYPNYFDKSSNMTGVNDGTGIIPFKKGKSTEIDQEAAHATTQSEP